MFFANFDYINPPPFIYMVGKPRILASFWHQAIEIWSILQAVRISVTDPDRLLNSSWHCVIEGFIHLRIKMAEHIGGGRGENSLDVSATKSSSQLPKVLTIDVSAKKLSVNFQKFWQLMYLQTKSIDSSFYF